MDLEDVQTMLEDAIAFAREVRNEMKARRLEGSEVCRGVIEYKIAAIRKTISTFRPKKDEIPRFSKLKSDLLTLERDCQPLLLSLDHYNAREPSPPLSPSSPRQVSMEFLTVQPYFGEESKAESFEAIAKDFAGLREIASDTAELIGSQGIQLVKVENHVDEAKDETAKAGEELKAAAVIQNKKWKWYFGSGLGTVGGIIGLIAGPLGVSIGATLGGIAGAAVGKAIEKHENSALQSITFETE